MAKCNREPLTAYLAFKAPASERERLEQVATSLDRPLSWVIRLALRAHLDNVGNSSQGQGGAVSNG